MPSRALVLAAVALLAGAACGSSSNAPAPGSPYAPGAADGATDGRDASGDGADAARAVDAGDAGVDAGDVATDVVAPVLTATVVTTIALPGVPVAGTYNAGTKKVYLACQTPDAGAAVAVVDDVANAVVTTISSAAAVTSLAANATTKIVYGAEGAQIDVIDSTTDMIATTVKIPDSSVIAGLAVDEVHNKTFAVTTIPPFTTELFSLDGATNVLTALRNPLLKPTGAPVLATDGPTQKVFVLGVDSNSAAVIVTLDGPSGAPTALSTPNNLVDPSVSGLAPLGNGTASVLLLKPGIVKGLEQRDVALPATFKPAGVAAADLGAGPLTLVVGFDVGLDAAAAFIGYGVDTATGALSAFGVPLTKSLPANTAAARLVTAAAIAGGRELYVAPTPDPQSTAPFSPTVAIKLAVTSAPP
jgi:hypothetical protein